MIPESLLEGVRDAPDVPESRWGVADWLEEYAAERDWNDYLDAFPNHHDIRLRFAAWLAARGDERADGIRALAHLCISPTPSESSGKWAYICAGPVAGPDLSKHALPEDWFNTMHAGERWMLRYVRSVSHSRRSREAIENEAAWAFAQLPEQLRAKLLKTKVVTP